MTLRRVEAHLPVVLARHASVVTSLRADCTRLPGDFNSLPIAFTQLPIDVISLRLARA